MRRLDPLLSAYYAENILPSAAACPMCWRAKASTPKRRRFPTRRAGISWERSISLVTGFEAGQTVTTMPIHGCYALYLCVSQRKLVPVPGVLDQAEAVAVVLNYITAYQMLHRSAKAGPDSAC